MSVKPPSSLIKTNKKTNKTELLKAAAVVPVSNNENLSIEKSNLKKMKVSKSLKGLQGFISNIRKKTVKDKPEIIGFDDMDAAHKRFDELKRKNSQEPVQTLEKQASEIWEKSGANKIDSTKPHKNTTKTINKGRSI